MRSASSDDALIKQIDVLFSGRERVQSAVTIVWSLGGLAGYRQAWHLAEFQGHHTNQACFELDIIPPE